MAGAALTPPSSMSQLTAVTSHRASDRILVPKDHCQLGLSHWAFLSHSHPSLPWGSPSSEKGDYKKDGRKVGARRESSSSHQLCHSPERQDGRNTQVLAAGLRQVQRTGRRGCKKCPGLKGQVELPRSKIRKREGWQGSAGSARPGAPGHPLGDLVEPLQTSPEQGTETR